MQLNTGRRRQRPSLLVSGTRTCLVKRPASPGRRTNSTNWIVTDDQAKAIERLADYPKRVERLKKLWADFQEESYAAAAQMSTTLPRAGSASRSGLSDFRVPAPRVQRPRQGRERSSSPRSGRVAAPPRPTGPLTQAQIRDLMNRDLTPEDYELLLMLDEGIKKAKTLNPDSAAFLPRAPGTDWVNEECTICLCALEADEDVRMMPACGHKFHAPCAERWLTSSKASCPLCGGDQAMQESVLQAFRRFDINGDGLFDANEMKEVLAGLDPGMWTDERVTRLFHSIDVDKDGKIDTQEFVNWVFSTQDAEKQRLCECMSI